MTITITPIAQKGFNLLEGVFIVSIIDTTEKHLNCTRWGIYSRFPNALTIAKGLESAHPAWAIILDAEPLDQGF